MKCTHILAAAALTMTLSAHAQTQTPPTTTGDHAAHHASAAAPQSDGEVRKVDKEQGKVTLRHGPLANLDMPPMTMVFKAADPQLLEGLKPGDKVTFTAEKVNGTYTVTAIQPAK